MRSLLWYTFAAVVGSLVGYAIVVIAWNLETWPMFTIRSAVTGRDSMMEILDHPADRWVCLTLIVLPVLIGGITGVVICRRFRGKSVSPTH